MKTLDDIAALDALAQAAGLGNLMAPVLEATLGAMRAVVFAHVRGLAREEALYCFVCEEVVAHSAYVRVMTTNVGPQPICVDCQRTVPADAPHH